MYKTLVEGRRFEGSAGSTNPNNRIGMGKAPSRQEPAPPPMAIKPVSLLPEPSDHL